MSDLNEQTKEVEEREDPIRLYIIDAIAGGKTVSPNDIAIKIAKDRAKIVIPMISGVNTCLL